MAIDRVCRVDFQSMDERVCESRFLSAIFLDEGWDFDMTCKMRLRMYLPEGVGF